VDIYIGIKGRLVAPSFDRLQNREQRSFLNISNIDWKKLIDRRRLGDDYKG